ncbi:hypothetical protein H310_14842 [Aphanomyces invadans]|uniref:Uncharacterized protein n=1 Tax=Aphanomyces invadans TaxID=157072 RepID=A0A024T9T5_9STRA|nr:hypothetical protein H310_14842 [Aphanomyces invadans]ETV90371.1 hypothetical protein H310_14842 [Aphanomyces invadans]|eukprot:XP_008881005.1 hypothetical protein H310_14842 [Aphanomyces invadans]
MASSPRQEPDDEPPMDPESWGMPLIPNAEVPQNVVDAMKVAGATYSTMSDGGLCMIEVRHGDHAWEVYEKWLNLFDGGTMLVCASFRPTVDEFDVCPSREKGSHITWEVNSIVHHFSGLTMDNLPVGQRIPAPTADTLVIEKMRDPRVALDPLIECLRDPPDTYETLHGLPAGSYLCDLQHIWTGTIVMMAIFK